MFVALCPSAQALDAAQCVAERADETRLKLAKTGFRKSDAPGMVLIVFGKSERYFSFFDGLVQRRGDQLALTSAWPLGRGSQLFLQMGVLNLAEAKRIRLHAPLLAQLPGAKIQGDPEQVKRITPALLLTHHAGLAQGRLQGLYQNADVAPAEIARTPWFLARPVDQLSGYSNQSGQILQQLLEHVTAQRYETWLRSELLEPLAMSSTQWQAPTAAVQGHRDGRPLMLRSTEPALFGAYASAEELVGLGQYLLGDRPDVGLAPAQRMRMLTSQHQTALDLDVGYGYGFTVTSSERASVGPVARVFLDSPGTQGELRLLPQLGIGSLTLANAAEAARPLAESARGVLDCTLMQRAQIAPSDDSTAPPENILMPKGFQPDAMATYYSTSGGLIEFEANGDNFDFDAFGLGFSARPRADGWFGVRYELFGALPLQFGFLKRVLLRPARMGNQRYLLGWFFGNRVLLGSTFKQQALDPAARELVGSWELENPDSLVETFRLSKIKIDEGSHGLSVSYSVPLVLRFTVRFPLQRVDAKTWVVPGTGALLGEPVRVLGSGSALRLDFAGYRLRRTR